MIPPDTENRDSVPTSNVSVEENIETKSMKKSVHLEDLLEPDEKVTSSNIDIIALCQDDSDSLPIFSSTIMLIKNLEQSKESLPTRVNIEVNKSDVTTYSDFTGNIGLHSTTQTTRNNNFGVHCSFKKVYEDTFTLLFNEPNIAVFQSEKHICDTNVKVATAVDVPCKSSIKPDSGPKRGEYVTPDPALLVKLQKPKGR